MGGSLSLTCSLLAVLTFLLDWRGGAKYPALSIFYLNLCLLLVAAGWLAQFSGRQDIVCRWASGAFSSLGIIFSSLQLARLPLGIS